MTYTAMVSHPGVILSHDVETRRPHTWMWQPGAILEHSIAPNAGPGPMRWPLHRNISTRADHKATFHRHCGRGDDGLPEKHPRNTIKATSIELAGSGKSPHILNAVRPFSVPEPASLTVWYITLNDTSAFCSGVKSFSTHVFDRRFDGDLLIVILIRQLGIASPVSAQ